MSNSRSAALATHAATTDLDALAGEGLDLAVRVAARMGLRVAPFTVARWCSRGIAGQRLEAVRVGRAWHTSDAALRRFLIRLTTASSCADSGSDPVIVAAAGGTHGGQP